MGNILLSILDAAELYSNNICQASAELGRYMPVQATNQCNNEAVIMRKQYMELQKAAEILSDCLIEDGSDILTLAKMFDQFDLIKHLENKGEN